MSVLFNHEGFTKPQFWVAICSCGLLWLFMFLTTTWKSGKFIHPCCCKVFFAEETKISRHPRFFFVSSFRLLDWRCYCRWWWKWLGLVPKRRSHFRRSFVERSLFAQQLPGLACAGAVLEHENRDQAGSEALADWRDFFPTAGWCGVGLVNLRWNETGIIENPSKKIDWTV